MDDNNFKREGINFAKPMSGIMEWTETEKQEG